MVGAAVVGVRVNPPGHLFDVSPTGGLSAAIRIDSVATMHRTRPTRREDSETHTPGDAVGAAAGGRGAPRGVAAVPSIILTAANRLVGSCHQVLIASPPNTPMGRGERRVGLMAALGLGGLLGGRLALTRPIVAALAGVTVVACCLVPPSVVSPALSSSPRSCWFCSSWP